jgi:hypothetical protein
LVMRTKTAVLRSWNWGAEVLHEPVVDAVILKSSAQPAAGHPHEHAEQRAKNSRPIRPPHSGTRRVRLESRVWDVERTGGGRTTRYQGRFPAASRAVGGSIRRVSGPCASSLSAKSSRSCVSIISRRSVPTYLRDLDCAPCPNGGDEDDDDSREKDLWVQVASLRLGRCRRRKQHLRVGGTACLLLSHQLAHLL